MKIGTIIGELVLLSMVVATAFFFLKDDPSGQSGKSQEVKIEKIGPSSEQNLKAEDSPATNEKIESLVKNNVEIIESRSPSSYLNKLGKVLSSKPQVNNKDSLAMFRGKIPLPGGETIKDATDNFLNEHAKELLDVSSSDLSDVKNNTIGSRHSFTYQQKYNGIPIFNAQLTLTVDSDSNSLVHMNSSLYPESKLYGELNNNMSLQTKEALLAVAQSSLNRFLENKKLNPKGYSPIEETNIYFRSGNYLVSSKKYLMARPSTADKTYIVYVDARKGRTLKVLDNSIHN